MNTANKKLYSHWQTVAACP